MGICSVESLDSLRTPISRGLPLLTNDKTTMKVVTFILTNTFKYFASMKDLNLGCKFCADIYLLSIIAQFIVLFTYLVATASPG